jgi:glycerol-3-phosphate dehydrogenase (NAD(P)+)
MNITIIGTGTWGTALARVLTDNGHDVLMVGKDAEQVKNINEFHQNLKYFPASVIFPLQLKATTSLLEGLTFSSHLILAVPSIAMRTLLENIKGMLTKPKLIINTAKGFDPSLHIRLSELIRMTLPKRYVQGVVSLLGPSHAEEVVARQLTLVSSTSKDVRKAQEVADLLANTYFRVYVQRDEIGAEVGAALKNVIAIASGVIAGMQLGDNARAALVTRGLSELMKLGKALGGKLKTHTGLTGLGDLMVTCYSAYSRNFQAGVIIGKADSAVQFLKENMKTVEGIHFAKIAHDLGVKYRLRLPIIDAVYAVLYEQKAPSEMVKFLMARPLKVE